MWRCLGRKIVLPQVSKLRHQLHTNVNSSLSTGRGAQRKPLTFTPNDIVHGFRIIRCVPIPQFNLTLFEMRHVETGAAYVHLDTADTTNTFSVAFRTPPSSCNGVTHILEHTVLCGSKKYSVRDPFFHMLRRSLNSFMNAMTGAEYTFYPFCTANAADFTNLTRVYVDAVFHPLLRYMDFMQEGHRLEFDTMNDATTALKRRGVVLNEMKGAMSEPGSVSYQELHACLLPDTPYRYNSGGDPSHIPELTHEALVQYHSCHYHPSNSRFFSYGDLPPQLSLLNELVLSKFTKQSDSFSRVPTQTLFTKPVEVSCHVPPDPMIIDKSKQTSAQVGFVLPDVPTSTDGLTTTALTLIPALLINGSDSPFHTSLIKPNIGTGYAHNTGLHSTRQPIFAVGLEGIADADVSSVEKNIDNTLTQCVEKGFDKARIESTLHQHEMAQKRVQTNFGLTLLARILPRWVHDGDVVAPLDIDVHLNDIRERQKGSGRFLEDLLQTHFVNNPHRCRLVTSASESFVEDLALKETNILNKLKPNSKELIASSLALSSTQSTPEDVSCLPSLPLSAIPKKSPFPPSPTSASESIMVAPSPTNGIMYTTAISNTKSLSYRSAAMLPLFSSIVTSLGTNNEDFAQTAAKRASCCSGVSTAIVSVNDVEADDDDDEDKRSNVSSRLYTIGTSALARNASLAMAEIAKVIETPRFDEHERIKQLIISSASEASASLVSCFSGVLSIALAPLSTLFAQRDLDDGFSSIISLITLAQRIEKNPSSTLTTLCDNLVKVSDELRQVGVHKAAVIGDDKHLISSYNAITDIVLNKHRTIIDLTHTKSSSNSIANSGMSPLKVIVTAPIDANHVTLALPTVDFRHEDSAALRVLARVMTTCYLHGEIREKGGAYGGGARWHQDGAISFYSFRDPECEATLKRFQSCMQWIQSSSCTLKHEDIEHALLSIFSSIDAPQHPSSLGIPRFIHGRSDESRQEHRERLLSTTLDDVVEVARKYLSEDMQKKASIAVMGSSQRADVNVMQAQGWSVKPFESLALPLPFDEDFNKDDIRGVWNC